LETVEYTRLPTQLDATLTAIPSDGTGIDAAVGSADLDHLTVLAEQQLEERRGDGARRPLLTATHRSRSVASRLLARQYPEIVVLAGEEYPPAYRLPPADPPP
jgi:flagellar biosynthesis component FlhA